MMAIIFDFVFVAADVDDDNDDVLSVLVYVD